MAVFNFVGNENAANGTSLAVLQDIHNVVGHASVGDVYPSRLTAVYASNALAGTSYRSVTFNTVSAPDGAVWLTGFTAYSALSGGGSASILTAVGYLKPIAITSANAFLPATQNVVRAIVADLFQASDTFEISGAVSSIWGDYQSVSAGTVTLGDDYFRLGVVALATGSSSVVIYGDAQTVTGGTVVAGDDIIDGVSSGVALTLYGDFQVVSGGNVSYGDDIVIGGSGSDVLYGDSSGSGVAGGNDRLLGGAGADTLYGGGGYDILIGGSGADLIDGGDGFDYAAYFYTAVTVDMLAPTANTSDAIGDVLVNIEGLMGSAFADTLSGNNGANWIYGNGGNDTIFGRGGDDVLIGGLGDDFIYGDANNDLLFGGDGYDTLFGGAGADALYGEEGFDFAAYTYAPTGVTADLLFANANTGEAAGDVYSSIEGLIGSGLADSLRGDNGSNWIKGGDGGDTIFGRGGDDVIIGEAGNDFMAGEAGNDTFVFNAGFGQDFIADFTSGIGATDVLNILLGAAYDTYAEVMAVATQVGSNTLIAFDANNTLTLQNVIRNSMVADDFRFV